MDLALILVAVFVKQRAFTRRLRPAHVAIGLSVVAASYLAWRFLDAFAAQSVSRDAALSSAAISYRLIHWREMIEALMRSPWSGYGWMGVSAAQYAVVLQFPTTYEAITYSHNLVIDLLIWTGIPFGLLIVACLIAWLWRVASRVADPATLLALIALLTLVSYAQVEFPLAYTFFLMPAGALAGVLCAGVLPTSARPMPAWIVPIWSLAAGVLLALVLCDYLESERQLQTIRFDQARVGLQRARPTASPLRLLTQLDALLRFARTTEREGMGDAELRAMGHVVERFPSGPNLVRYAAALALNGQPDAAAGALQRVCKYTLPHDCDAMQKLWNALGEQRPATRQVAWPSPDMRRQ